MIQRELIFDADVGEQLKHKGIQRAADNAEAVRHGWQSEALNFLRLYPFETFMAEDLRQYAYDNGLPHPPHDRAWGSVILAAKRMGWIVFERFALVANAKAHRTPASVWRKTNV